MIERSGFNSPCPWSFQIRLWCAIHPSQVLSVPLLSEVHCVFAHPTYSQKIPLCLFAKSSQFWRVWVQGIGHWAQLQYYGFYCTLERTTFSVLKDKTKLLHVHDLLQRQPGITPDSKSACCAIFISELALLVPMVKSYGQNVLCKINSFYNVV